MRYLWLCLSSIILGCSSQPNPFHQQADLKSYVEEVTGESNLVFDTGYVDLNGDGLNDALVLLKGMQWCGSGGCTLMVFENLGDSYQFISNSTITSTPISVTKAEHHGWKGLIVRTRGKGLVLMAFDGDKYPRNPSLAPSVSRSENQNALLILE